MTEPVIDKSYEQGYKDGESSVTADIDFCLSEEWGIEEDSWRDGIRKVYEAGVAEEHSRLFKAAQEYDSIHNQRMSSLGLVTNPLAATLITELMNLTNQGETK